MTRTFLHPVMVKQAYAKHALMWQERDTTYNARGRALVLKYNNDWNDELESMNRSKAGRPFAYSDSLMTFATIHKT